MRFWNVLALWLIDWHSLQSWPNYTMFHVSMVRRYRSDESHILPVQEIQVHEDFSYDEEPKAILAREVKQLQNKQVQLVKVLWQHHGREEATWEPIAIMRAQYPKLFESGMNFEEKILFKGEGGRVVTPQIMLKQSYNMFSV